jgi:hypothetical protein
MTLDQEHDARHHKRGDGRLGRGDLAFAFVAVAGIAVAWAAFSLTSGGTPPFQADHAYSAPCASGLEAPGFDPWTGQPHGQQVNCDPVGINPAVVIEQRAVPAEMVGRWAIPLPVGFLIGCLGAAGVLLLIDRRLRPPDRTLAESGAVGGIVGSLGTASVMLLIKLRRLLRPLAFVVVVGMTVGWAAFFLTSGAPPLYTFSIPPCTTSDYQIDAPGFDPWTGQPHGLVFVCGASAGEDSVPAEMVGRRAIAVPVGFLIGATLAGGVVLLIDRRSKTPDRTMAGSGAVGSV